jgi:GT2 family glycosyltransferase
MDGSANIGLTTCQLHNADGSDQKTADLFPIPFHEINILFAHKRRALLTKVAEATNSRSSCSVETVIGAFQLLPRDLLIAVGKLDDSLFMYGEDLDLCYRIRKAGRKVVYDASVSIVHLGGRSSALLWNDSTRLSNVRQSIFIVHCKHFGVPAALGSLYVRLVLSSLRSLAAITFRLSDDTKSSYATEACANRSTLNKARQLIKTLGASAV